MNADRLITAVAADMTAAEPPADLAARVVDRITTPRRPTWKLASAPLMAAAALMAWVVLVPRDVTQPFPAPDAAFTGSMATSPADVVVAASMPRILTRAGRRRSGAGLSDSERAWQRRAIPALPGPATLGTRSIQPDALRIPLLDMKPIATAPIAITPIGDGGDPRDD